MRRMTVLAGLLTAGSLVATACAAGGPQGGGGTISDDKIVLGVLNDQSDIYADLSGKNGVTAVRMAVEDFKKNHGEDAVTDNIEVISADHQNEPSIANTKAQEMYDREGADVIIDVPTSSAALAVANVAAQSEKLFLNVGAATTELTGEQCNAYTFHWAYDTYMLAHGTGTTVTNEVGESWYLIYPDYAFGQDMQKQFTNAIEAAGGKVVSKEPTPFPNDDFSTFLIEGKNMSPKPEILGTMHAGGDLVNVAKQYDQFNLQDQGIDLSVGLMFLTDVHSIGPEVLAGTTYTTAWYWNLDERSRSWADRFQERTGSRPTFAHAGDYSAALQYLEAVQRAGTDGSGEVAGELEGHEFDDVFARNATVRAADHRMVHDAYLAEVKQPERITEPRDYVRIRQTIPADEAFRPVSEAPCDLGS